MCPNGYTRLRTSEHTNIRTWVAPQTNKGGRGSDSFHIRNGELFYLYALHCVGLSLNLNKHLTCLDSVTEIFVNLWFRFLIINCLFLNDLTARGAETQREKSDVRVNFVVAWFI